MAKNNKRKRRRIVSNGRREFSSSNYVTDSATSHQLRRKRTRPTAEMAEENFAPDGSCCSSSNGSVSVFVDLEEEEYVLQDEHSTRETTPSRSEFCSSDEEEGMDSNVKTTTTTITEANSNSTLVKTTPVKIPHSELEEFFAQAEKTIHKRFAEKYNYDFVKDIPLEGRYEWEQLKP